MNYRLTYRSESWAESKEVEFKSDENGTALLVEALDQIDWHILEEDEEILVSLEGLPLPVEWEFHSRSDTWLFMLEAL